MVTKLDEMLSGEEANEEEMIEGPEAEPDPVRKEVANYRPAEGDGEACENCQFFIKPEGCSRVLGKISASGVCDLFEIEETEELVDEGLDSFLFSGADMMGGMGEE